MKKIKKEIARILKKNGNMQTNLESENAQKQITEEFQKNIYKEYHDTTGIKPNIYACKAGAGAEIYYHSS